MDRRRALIAAQAATPSLKLSDLTAGDPVKFSVSGKVYIYLGIKYGNAQILREQVIDSSTKKTSLTYVDGAADTYLTGTYYDSFSTAQQAKMRDSDVGIYVSDKTTRTSATITRKIYMPPTSLIGGSGTALSALKRYYNTTSTNTARIAKDSGGTARSYWTSDANSSDVTMVTVISSAGAAGSNSAGATNYYIRPVISVDKDAEVELINGAYVIKT